MSNHEYYTSNLIPFSAEPSLLGIDTNGASPEQVFGLFIEAEIYDHQGEITENYFLKARTTKTPFDRECTQQDAEFLMWSGTIQQIDMVIGNIVSASVIKNWDKMLNGKFDSYQNQSQQDFSEDASSECIDNLNCRVSSTETGFAIRFFDKTSTISSLHAKLESKAVTTALDEIKSLREWADGNIRMMLKNIAAQENKPAPLNI